MARVTAPLFGLDASGSLAGAIVFSKWKGRQYVRRHAIPANPKSGLQVGMRSVFGYVTAFFTDLDPAELTNWTDEAVQLGVAPLNVYVRDAQRRARQNLGWRADRVSAVGATSSAPTSVGVVELPLSLTVNWTNCTAVAPDYCTAIYMSTTTGFAPDISNLVAVVNRTITSVTIRNLSPGTDYFFRGRHINRQGGMGALFAQEDGTPTA